MIAYTIESAQMSLSLTACCVSTEDEEIAAVSRRWGADVIRRPENLAMDETPMLPVIQHALEKLGGNQHFDFVIILQPTCPMRTARDIDRSVEILAATSADSVISVYRVEDQHPGRMYRIAGGYLMPYDAALVSVNRQDLPAVFHRNGAIYGVKASVAAGGSLFGETIIPYVMPRHRSLNIDDAFDWKFAEWLMRTEAT